MRLLFTVFFSFLLLGCTACQKEGSSFALSHTASSSEGMTYITSISG